MNATSIQEKELKQVNWRVKRKHRRLFLLFLSIISLILASVYGIISGSVSVSLQEFIALFSGNADPLTENIVWNLRLPRVVLGILVGACLAVSGGILQGVTRNPLADPGIIGISAGGGLAAVITMLVFPAYSYLLPVAAFIGALSSALLIYVMAWKDGVSVFRMILAGVAVNALLGAITSGIMLLYSDSVQSVLPWLSGGLNGKGWHEVRFFLPYAVIGLTAAMLLIRSANISLLGEDRGKLLGFHVERQRFYLILVAALLAGAAVSVAGLIGFVGLVVPHIIRLLIGGDYRFLHPLSALSGAALVVFADTGARSWFGAIELPVGILMACIGAPFFLMLLRKGGLR